MKRIGLVICLVLMIIIGSGGMVWGAEAFTIEKTSPEDGSTGMSVDNMGVKLFFNKDIYNKDNEKANVKLLTLTDNKGKKVPSKVVFSEKYKDVVLVLADTGGKGTKEIKGKTKYTLKVEAGLKAADGTIMKEGEKITFETLDPKSSMTVSMVMMGLMVVGMIFFTSREAKKQAEKNSKQSKREEKVNPYKVAKETGKSVEEIVEKDQKRKKRKAAAAARKEKSKEDKTEKASDNMRVKGPRPISAVGAKYRHVKVKSGSEGKGKNGGKNRSGAKSTNPKNQTGKQRNKRKKR